MCRKVNLFLSLLLERGLLLDGTELGEKEGEKISNFHVRVPALEISILSTLPSARLRKYACNLWANPVIINLVSTSEKYPLLLRLPNRMAQLQ